VVTRFRDRTVLFGDAGGAVVLRAGEGKRGILGFQLHSDGANFKERTCPGSGLRTGRSSTRSRSASGATVVQRDSPRQRANVALAERSSRRVPNGILELRLVGEYCADAVWKDKKRQPLEACLGEVVGRMPALAAQTKRERAEREHRQIAEQEATSPTAG